MSASVIFLLSVSLATLVIGLFAWRLTSSKPLILNMLFASVGFLLAAYGVASSQPGELPFVVPFLATMLVGGRALGTYWRAFAKGERELRAPSHLLGVASLMGIAGSAVAFAHL